MKEIITIGVGQAGVQISESTWEQHCRDSFINEGTKKVNSTDSSVDHRHFVELSNGKCTARAVLCDLDPEPICRVRKRNLGGIFMPDSLISSKGSAASNYCEAHYVFGKSISDKIMDQSRKLLEQCDFVQGVRFIAALGGGTGGAISSHVINQLKIDNPKITVTMDVIFPSPKSSPLVVEPYNTVLAFHDIYCNVDELTLFDNEAISRFCDVHIGIEYADYKQINSVMAYFAASYHPKNLHFRDMHSHLKSLRDQPLNSASFAGMNTAPISPALQAPLIPKSSLHLCSSTLPCISGTSFSGSYLSNSVRPGLLTGSSTLCASKHSSRHLCGPLETLSSKFDRLYAKRAFVHWYVGIGLSEGFFSEAREDLECTKNRLKNLGGD